jgi:hypothetical protein
MRWWWALALLGLMRGEPSAQPSTTIYAQNFDAGLGGWTVSPSIPGYPAWAADGTPASMPGGAAWSAPSSLNFNNGTNYLPSGAGTATSPVVDLTGTTSPVLTFRCNYQTETPLANSWDARRVQISNNNFASLLFNQSLGQFGASPLVGACSAMGTWHVHTVALDPAWGTVRIRVSFDTIDPVANYFSGWFVDDVAVTVASPPPPPPPPPGGGGSPAASDDDDSRTHAACGGSAGAAGVGWAWIVAMVAAVVSSRNR